MTEIIFQSSRLSSMFPKKPPTADFKGLSNDIANPWATTLPLSNTQEPTGPHPEGAPVNFNLAEDDLAQIESLLRESRDLYQIIGD